jgi:hypothetical protein
MLRIPAYELGWAMNEVQAKLDAGEPVSSSDLEDYVEICEYYTATYMSAPQAPTDPPSYQAVAKYYCNLYAKTRDSYLASIAAADEAATVKATQQGFSSFEACFGSGRRRRLPLGLHQIHPLAVHLHPKLAVALPADSSLTLLHKGTQPFSAAAAAGGGTPSMLPALVPPSTFEDPAKDPPRKSAGRPNRHDNKVCIEAYQLQVNDDCAAMAEGWPRRQLGVMLAERGHVQDTAKPLQPLCRQQWRAAQQQPEQQWPDLQEQEALREEWSVERVTRMQAQEQEQQEREQRALRNQQRQQEQQQQQKKKVGKRRSGGVEEEEPSAKRHKVRSQVPCNPTRHMFCHISHDCCRAVQHSSTCQRSDLVCSIRICGLQLLAACICCLAGSMALGCYLLVWGIQHQLPVISRCLHFNC